MVSPSVQCWWHLESCVLDALKILVKSGQSRTKPLLTMRITDLGGDPRGGLCNVHLGVNFVYAFAVLNLPELRGRKAPVCVCVCVCGYEVLKPASV